MNEEQIHQTAPEEELQARHEAELERLRTLLPELKAEDVDEELWQAFDEGRGELPLLYLKKENSRLFAELEQLRQEETNRSRSAGSRQSAPAPRASDPFDEAWDSFNY